MQESETRSQTRSAEAQLVDTKVELGASDWLEIARATSPSDVFLASGWLEVWWDSEQRVTWQAKTPCYLRVRRGNRVVAVIPCARVGPPLLGLRMLAGYYYPYRTVFVANDVTESESIADALADHLENNLRQTGVRFGPVRASDRSIALLLRSLKRRAGWQIMRRKLGELYGLTLPEGAADPSEFVDKSLIKSVRYEVRRLERLGRLQLCVAEYSSGNLISSLRKIQAIESKSWVGQRGKPLFFSGDSRRFWEAAVVHPSFAGHLRLFTHELDDIPISYSIVIDSGPKRIVIANGYDAAYAKHSPGNVLTHAVIQDALRTGHTELEWGQGDSGYKTRWGARVTDSIVDFVAVPRSILGSCLKHSVLLPRGFLALDQL